MSPVALLASRARDAAATRRIAASSALPQKVPTHFLGTPGNAPGASRFQHALRRDVRRVSAADFSALYERSLRPCGARVSPPQHTICSRSDR